MWDFLWHSNNCQSVNNRQILRISIYFKDEDRSKGGTSGGAGNRVKYYKGPMGLDDLLRSQMSDGHDSNSDGTITTSPLKGRGELLVTGKSYIASAPMGWLKPSSLCQ